MKFLRFLALFVIALVPVSAPAEEKEAEPASIYGKWKFSPEGGVPIVVEFFEDGKVVQRMGKRKKAGRLSLSKDGTVLTVELEGDGFSEEFEIVSLTPAAMVLESEDEKIPLARVSAAPGKPDAGADPEPDPAAEPVDGKADASLLHGRWKLFIPEGEGISEKRSSWVFEFKPDGTIIRSAGESKRGGTYRLSDDGKSLTLKRDGADEGEVMRVLSMSATALELDDEGKKVKLVREAAGQEPSSSEGEPAPAPAPDAGSGEG